jgi:hypothetical protein
VLSSKSRDKSFTSDFSKEASNNIRRKDTLDKRKITGTNKIQKEKP